MREEKSPGMKTQLHSAAQRAQLAQYARMAQTSQTVHHARMVRSSQMAR